jgi:hypothetical protein
VTNLVAAHRALLDVYCMLLTTRTVGALGQMGHQAGGDYWLRW